MPYSKTISREGNTLNIEADQLSPRRIKIEILDDEGNTVSFKGRLTLQL
jgi:hypothetical protein